MATINLTTATVTGSIVDGEPFEFTISSAQGTNVTITGKDEVGSTDSWFTPNPATIVKNTTSVTVTAAQTTPIGEYVTYVVTGMNVNDAAHIVVGAQMPGGQRHERKAS
jgi:hypothetical protein